MQVIPNPHAKSVLEDESALFGLEDGPGLQELARDLTRGKDHLKGRLDVNKSPVVPSLSRLSSMPSPRRRQYVAPSPRNSAALANEAHPVAGSAPSLNSPVLPSPRKPRNKKEADAEFRRLQTQNPSVEDGAAVCRFSPLTAAYRDSKLYVVDP